MNRELVMPLLSRGWASTKWNHARLHTWTFMQVGEKLRVGAWVDWDEGWGEVYTCGWYLIERTGGRISWSLLYEGGQSALDAVKEWVCALE